MTKPYDYRDCQSLFGYAQKVHECSGGVCQLCGCGAGAGIDFDLWRQMTVEHLIGQSQGGYLADIRVAVASRFPDCTHDALDHMAQRIDEANTITACSFCNSTTSRDRNAKSVRELLFEAHGGPQEVLQSVIASLQEIHERKKRAVARKLSAVRTAFEALVAEKLEQARRPNDGCSISRTVMNV